MNKKPMIEEKVFFAGYLYRCDYDTDYGIRHIFEMLYNLRYGYF